mmetsp:Transcript_13010/g.14646  ORF Transcript_13010/g.14646 Transcript_13010/m.14646 type:complete len:108 (-) Transcript_13010:85-408(-)|eukprot:CAMPEP_0205819090 /NCGR_PEP_ID=MMETSP0206-20130828/1293_1 /ASSEMBLY_ACC=CAM_ASM_000279 /TAXON_ID=36767 /ORGANISM="Euplotes focardii, Strain TN1" /LENGTH=107 /DNA_ID=CAMNT_0053112213 /DNA_START=26 /DNA_END=349 /DNA_ORIENTATION=+
MADPCGVWEWQYDGGKFEVEVQDGGTFFCKQYPEHSHWEQKADEITIKWGQYGTYDMKVDAGGKAMSGHHKGFPDDWRKATLIRAHTAAERAKHKAAAAAHNHGHGH